MPMILEQPTQVEVIIRKAAHALLPFLVLSVNGCSNQEMYEAVQSNRLAACQEFVGRRYDDCIAQYEADYRDFSRERSEAIER